MALVLVPTWLFGKRDVGCYAAGWDANLTLVNLAVDHGYPADAYDMVIVANCWASPDDHYSWGLLADLADDALDYLNTITHPVYRWAWVDGELVLDWFWRKDHD